MPVCMYVPDILGFGQTLGPNPIRNRRFSAGALQARSLDVANPYKSIGVGAMDVTKPYNFIGFGALLAQPSNASAPKATPKPAPKARPHTGCEAPTIGPRTSPERSAELWPGEGKNPARLPSGTQLCPSGTWAGKERHQFLTVVFMIWVRWASLP